MDPIRKFSTPDLRRPVAIIAFEGWNDACEAASGAVTYLLGLSDTSEPFAVVEPEEFFDFQQHRPTVHIDEYGPRRLSWPVTNFFAATRPDVPRDLILVLGDEPSHRWKTFSRSIAAFLMRLDVELVVLLGAFIGQVPHTRPLPIVGTASDPALLRGEGLSSSGYEGPTGIIAVLQEALREVGLPAVSLWAATPHYLAANPNPEAMLALIRRTGRILDADFDTSELERVAEEFGQRVEQAVYASDEFAGYVSELERSQDREHGDLDPIDDADPDALVSEIEDFLRKRN